ncbi:MAG TPA: putative zinc-binding protein [Rubrivivax sp.]|nr:putative zinc-binding protein [Rubrivivax sp.]
MTLPLVYSCSGCSSAAQLANHAAVRLDREGLAEMSCIAGLGGDVPSLTRKAHEAVTAGRPIVAIDGCVLACARKTLSRHGIAATQHVELWRLGVRKRLHEDFSAEEAAAALTHCRGVVAGAGTA